MTAEQKCKNHLKQPIWIKPKFFVFVCAGLHPICPYSLPILPLRQLSSNLQEKEEKHSTEEEKQKKGHGEGVLLEEGKKDERSCVSQQHQQRFFPAARSLFQGHSSMSRLALGSSLPINRERIFSLEPFHQSSIIRTKRGREEEKEEEDKIGDPTKKAKLTSSENSETLCVVVFSFFMEVTVGCCFASAYHWLAVIPSDSTLEDVRKLKVCIELNGLHLNKPHLPRELSSWLPPSQRSAEINRKFRMGPQEVLALRERSQVNGGWCDPTFRRRDGQRGKPGQTLFKKHVFLSAFVQWQFGLELLSLLHVGTCKQQKP